MQPWRGQGRRCQKVPARVRCTLPMERESARINGYTSATCARADFVQIRALTLIPNEVFLPLSFSLSLSLSISLSLSLFPSFSFFLSLSLFLSFSLSLFLSLSLSLFLSLSHVPVETRLRQQSESSLATNSATTNANEKSTWTHAG